MPIHTESLHALHDTEADRMGTTSDFHAWLDALDRGNPTELYALFESVSHEEDYGSTWRIEAAQSRLRITGAHIADTLVLKRANKQHFLDELERRCFYGLDFEDWYAYARNLRNPNPLP